MGQLGFLEERIERVASLVDGQAIRLPATITHCHAMDDKGRRWVRKRDSDTGPESTVAEAISWLVGREIGVPLPAAAVHGVGTAELSWLSGLVDPMIHWDADKWDLVSNQEAMGAVIALDAITLNEDRHNGNILLEATDEGRLRLWAIDSGLALVGRPAELRGRIGEIPAVTDRAPGYRGQVVRDVASAALEAARRAAMIPPHTLFGFASEAASLLPKADAPDVAALVDVVRVRCEAAEKLTAALLQATGGIS